MEDVLSVYHRPYDEALPVFVRERRTALDFAHVAKVAYATLRMVRFLVERKYADAVRVVIVLDNLNTEVCPKRSPHGSHSLYEAFDPATAKGIVDRIEWHFTPKHGAWLNREIASGDFLDMAEIELSVLAKQCLSERMGSREHLASQVAAWQERRDKAKARANWQFTTEDARVKLRKLYPQILTG